MGGVLRKGTKSTKKFFFKITDVLYQMIKSTSILHINLFLKKNKIWSLFPALTPFQSLHCTRNIGLWMHDLQKRICLILLEEMKRRLLRNIVTSRTMNHMRTADCGLWHDRLTL
jgi:hypothetical protein